jgi:hypothetical protein
MSVQTLTAPTVAASPYTITHNLGTINVLVQMYDAVTQRQVQAQVAALNTNQIQVSVATNMPNNVNVIIMGATASPVPLFPADLATKAYVDSRTPNLPAPITSGSGINSYTDPTGEVFVAQNGVNNGVWKRARDVLKTRVYRVTAYNLPVSTATMVYDAVNKDDYGLYNTSTGAYTVPITGWYRFHGQIQAGSQAAGSYLQINILVAGTTFAQDTTYYYGTGVYMVARAHDLLYFPAGQTVVFQVRASTAAASAVGNLTDYATFDYVGSG